MEQTRMEEVNWNHIIRDFRGPFLPSDKLENESQVMKLLRGIEPWELAEDEIERGLPEYDEQIEKIRRECDQEQREQSDAADLNSKLVAQSEGEQLWVPLFQRPQRFPRISVWNQHQQRFVVDRIIKYWATGVPANPPLADAKNVEKFVRMIENVRAEQEEYFEFAREVNKTQMERYTHHNQVIEAYMRKRLLTGHSRVRRYPRLYHAVRMLAMAPEAASAAPALQPVGEPLQLGQVPVLTVPGMRWMTSVRRHAVFLEVFHPSHGGPPCLRGQEARQEEMKQQQQGNLLYKTPVSEDPNVSFLARALAFSCVMTPSVWKVLLDNAAPWDKQWDIPVTVRDVAGSNPGEMRRVVLLDKPLPPRCVTVMDKRQMALKRMARILTCRRHPDDADADYSQKEQRRDKLGNPGNNGKKAKKKNKKQQNKDQQSGGAEEIGVASANADELETFGAVLGPVVSAPPVADETDDDDDDSEDEGLRIDCDDDDEEDESDNQEASPKSKRLRSGKEVTLDANRKAEPVTPAKQSGFVTAASPATPESPPAPLGRVTRSQKAQQATNLQSPPQTPSSPSTAPATTPDASTSAAAPPEEAARSSAPSAAAQEQATVRSSKPHNDGLLRPPLGLNVEYRVWQLGGLQILIRSSTHGMRENSCVEDLVRYSVHAKPAYQAYYGLEVMTRPELIRQWTDCVLRPNSRVLRVHVEPISLNVVMAEERTLTQLTSEFSKYDTRFRPQYGLQVLESLLSELPQLSPGQYMLSHDPRAGAFARLLRADAGADGGFDLRRSFGLAPRLAPLQWPPPCLSIDPSVLTTYNIKHGRIPATFDYHATNGLTWKEYWEKRKNESGFTRNRKKKNKGAKRKQETSQDAANDPANAVKADKG